MKNDHIETLQIARENRQISVKKILRSNVNQQTPITFENKISMEDSDVEMTFDNNIEMHDVNHRYHLIENDDEEGLDNTNDRIKFVLGI